MCVRLIRALRASNLANVLNMGIVRVFIYCFCLLLVMFSRALAEEWHDIKPMYSTRSDVIRLLGNCLKSDRDSCTYELDKETVTFQFLGKTCKATRKRLTRGTVLRIHIIPKTDARLTDYHKFDYNHYSLYFSHAEANTTYEEYVDDDEGFALEARNGKVTQVYYTATSRDADLCPDSYIKPSNLFSDGGKVLAEIFCPKIHVDCTEESIGANLTRESATFSASIVGFSSYVEPTYMWSVSAGKITNGQGTSTITVDTKGLPRGLEIKVTLEVGGAQPWCEHSASCTYKVK